MKFANNKASTLELLVANSIVSTNPSFLTVEPTSECNFRCKMCIQGHDTYRPWSVEIDDQALERALSIFTHVETIATQIVGEPTLSRKLGVIVDRAYESGTFVDMITNGS